MYVKPGLPTCQPRLCLLSVFKSSLGETNEANLRRFNWCGHDVETARTRTSPWTGTTRPEAAAGRPRLAKHPPMR